MKSEICKRRSGKKTVILSEDYGLSLSVCLNGFQTFGVSVDDEVLRMAQEVIQEYFEERKNKNLERLASNQVSE